MECERCIPGLMLEECVQLLGTRRKGVVSDTRREIARTRREIRGAGNESGPTCVEFWEGKLESNKVMFRLEQRFCVIVSRRGD